MSNFNNKKICTVGVTGYYIRLDGTGISAKEPGTYLWYKTSDNSIRIEIKQAPCNAFSLCVVSVAMKLGTDVLDMKMQGPELLIYLNGVQKIFSTHLTIGSYSLQRSDNILHRITGPSGFDFKVHRLDVYMNLYFKPATCIGTTGICSDCSTTKNYAITQADVIQSIASNAVTSGISKVSSSTESKAGFAVYLDGVSDGAASDQVPTAVTTSMDGWITLDFTMKVVQPEGVFFTYADDKVFALYLANGKLGVQFGDERLLTDFTVDTNQWITLAVSYEKKTGRILLSQYKNKVNVGKVLDKFTEFTFKPDMMPDKGKLSLGKWQMTDSNIGTSPPGRFVGYIDRLLIWKNLQTVSDMLEHSDYYILSKEAMLSEQWPFDEGIGETAFGKVQHTSFRIPSNGNIVSTARITQGEVSQDIAPESSFSNEEVKIQAEQACTKYLNSGVLTSICGTTQFKQARDFLNMMCLSAISESGRLSKSMDAVKIMSQICQDTGNAAVLAEKALCNVFPEARYTAVIGPNCNQQCLFGEYDTQNQNCKCDPMNRGTSCDQFCYRDDNNNVCSGHGTCGNDVKCNCESKWSGNTECSACTVGWSGAQCHVATSTDPIDPNVYMCTYSEGKLLQWSRQGGDVPPTGQMDMLSAGFIRVTVSVVTNVLLISGKMYP